MKAANGVLDRINNIEQQMQVQGKHVSKVAQVQHAANEAHIQALKANKLEISGENQYLQG